MPKSTLLLAVLPALGGCASYPAPGSRSEAGSRAVAGAGLGSSGRFAGQAAARSA